MSATPDSDHTMVSEFGEEVSLRPGGCPSCGADFVTVYADRCWRCGARFSPISAIDEPPAPRRD